MRKRAISGAAVALAGVVLLALAVAGCGLARRGSETSEAPVIAVTPAHGHDDAETADRVGASQCPADLRGCRSVEGRIVYVEAHDPDGDGDAHFVVLDSQGITLPGLTAIDVGRRLRPRPLPGIGGLISAAGPVEVGSHGQRQIHALEVHVAGQ
jgi:hypothetical protein